MGILWRSKCLLFANVLARTFQNMVRRVQSCLEANGGHFQRMLCRHISHTRNVFLFKFRCSIIIGVRIIKEMPGLVGSGTLCIFEVNFPVCDVCNGQFDTGTRFSPSTSVFPCQYHSTDAPHSSPSTCCSYQKTKNSRLQKSMHLEIWVIGCKDSFHSPSFLKG
jgi:hypothetical protein